MPLKAYAISGPTGVGKTDVALRLAQVVNGELISVDSVQVFQHLSIGANKYSTKSHEPSQHLIDQVCPSEQYNSSMYFESLIVKLKEVFANKKIPILVGGTAFYYDWIFSGRSSVPPIPKSVGDFVTSILEDQEWNSTIHNLQAMSYVKPNSINTNDFYRLKRSIEIFLFTGRSRDTFPRIKNEYISSISWFSVYLTSERIKIYRAVDKRCEEMILNGLIEETVNLMRSGIISKNTSSGRAIGYNEAMEFISEYTKYSDINSKIEAFFSFLRQFQASTRGLVRKQDVWFSRKLSNFLWIHKNFENPEENQFLACKLAKFILDNKFWISLKESSNELKDNRENKQLREYKSILQYFIDDISVRNYLNGLDNLLQP